MGHWRRLKYGNQKTVIDGITFDSKKEGNRYAELKMLQMAKEISQLEVQPRFDCRIRGKHICNYFADFKYYDHKQNIWVVEDVKGVQTAVFKLKKKLVEALYPIEIVIVG